MKKNEKKDTLLYLLLLQLGINMHIAHCTPSIQDEKRRKKLYYTKLKSQGKKEKKICIAISIVIAVRNKHEHYNLSIHDEKNETRIYCYYS